MHVAFWSVKAGSNVKPRPRKNAIEALRSLTGRLTNSIRDIRAPSGRGAQAYRPTPPGELIGPRGTAMSFRAALGHNDRRPHLGWTRGQETEMTQTQSAISETPEEFDEVAQRYRRELVAHCYRMTGSVYEAEDMVQETYLRAWKAYHSFEGRSSVRTWLHRIATNVCLTNLEGKQRRPLPTGLGAPGGQAGDELVEASEVPWLQPIPDSMVDADAGSDPSTVVAARDSIRLAFVAALQHLPPRQRAVLILRDVLRWQAREVAEALDTTTAAVNSALQRAHAQLADAGLTA